MTADDFEEIDWCELSAGLLPTGADWLMICLTTLIGLIVIGELVLIGQSLAGLPI